MKNLTHFIILILISFNGSVSSANISQPVKFSPSYSLSSQLIESGKNSDPTDSVINKNQTTQPIHLSESKTEKTFNQQLQWRILNLLAQQLFDNNDQQLTHLLLASQMTYKTRTFSVSIISSGSDYYQVNIIDNQRNNETQLEIPRL